MTGKLGPVEQTGASCASRRVFLFENGVYTEPGDCTNLGETAVQQQRTCAAPELLSQRYHPSDRDLEGKPLRDSL